MFRGLLVCMILLAASPAWAGSDGRYPDLWDRSDPALQQQLERILADLNLAGAAERKQLAVALVDVTDLDEPRVAAVNGNHMLYAASIPKLAILLGAFVEVRDGNMQLDAETRASLTRMIRYSSNVDATRMLNRIGKQHLLEMLRSEEFLLYDPKVNGGLWVGKEYGKSAAYERDPLSNLSHGATAMQVARFYYLLETGRLVGKKLSVVMKSMLGQPGIDHKFVKGLRDYPDVEIYRKSGSWKRWHGDSAIVEAAGLKYIVVGLAEHGRGGDWLSRKIKPIHELMLAQHAASAGR